MQNTLFDQGLTLMLAGMGTVFVFLTFLVVAMALMAAVAKRMQAGSADVSEEELAAISGAIARHRNQ